MFSHPVNSYSMSEKLEYVLPLYYRAQLLLLSLLPRTTFCFVSVKSFAFTPADSLFPSID